MPTLLTGVGYIGAVLLRHLAEQPGAAPIVAFENFFCTSRAEALAALPDGVTLVEGDVADARDVARAFAALDSATEAAGADSTAVTVFHLAAQPSAAIATRDPATTERTNLVGGRVLLEAARERGGRVIFGGSFRVYGDELTGQTVSEATPYGKVGDLSHLSKVYVEQLARMLGLPFISVRLGVTYGLSPIMKTAAAFMTVPNLFCKRAIDGDVLNVLEDRPLAFIHVEDAAEALLTAAARPQIAPDARYQVLNAAPEVATIGQLARTVQRAARDRGTRVRIAGAASSEAGYSVESRLASDGFRPRYSLATGLGPMLSFFESQAR